MSFEPRGETISLSSRYHLPDGQVASMRVTFSWETKCWYISDCKCERELTEEEKDVFLDRTRSIFGVFSFAVPYARLSELVSYTNYLISNPLPIEVPHDNSRATSGGTES